MSAFFAPCPPVCGLFGTKARAERAKEISWNFPPVLRKRRRVASVCFRSSGGSAVLCHFISRGMAKRKAVVRKVVYADKDFIEAMIDEKYQQPIQEKPRNAKETKIKEITKNIKT